MVVHSKWSFKRSGRLHKFDCIVKDVLITFSNRIKPVLQSGELL